jgi:hypothetical protein
VQTLLANIQSRSVVFLSQSTVRQLWGLRPYTNQSSGKSAPVESGHELATEPTAVVEHAIMRYYASYYFPYFVDGATYSFHYHIGLINPRIHARWPIPTNVLVSSPSNRSGSATSHKQALDLLDLVLSGSSVGSYSSKAYAFVWLMAIINSVPDELFPAPGGRYLFFETAFSPWNKYPNALVHQHETADGGPKSLRTRLEQDLEVWKATAELSGISRAFRDEINTSQSENLLDFTENHSLNLRAVETNELSQFFVWLINGSRDGGSRIADASPLENGRRYRFVQKGRASEMCAKYESTYQVATFFQNAGIIMDIYRVAARADGSFEPTGTLIKNGEQFKPKVPDYRRPGTRYARSQSGLGYSRV